MKLLTVNQVAEKLNVSIPTIYSMVKQGKLRKIRVGKGRNFRITAEEIADFEKRNTTPLSIEEISASHVTLSHEEFCKIYEKPAKGGKSKSAGKSKEKGDLAMSKKKYHRKNFGFGRIIPRQNKNGIWRWDIEYKNVKALWVHEVVPEAMNEAMATEALLSAVQRTHELKINPGKVAQQDRESITFAQLAESYFEEYVRLEKRRPRNDKYIIDAQLVPYFGNMTLDADYDSAIARYKAKRLEDNGRKEPIKRQSINYELAIARAIFNWAKKQKKYGILENPFSGKMFSCGYNRRTRTLTEEEEGTLLAQLPEHAKAIANCSLLTCMRRGEITSLQWPQVELENHRIKLEVEDNKSKRVRFIPICQDMYEEFLRLKSQNGNSRYVFTYNRKQVKDVRVSLSTACEKTGIEDLHFHDLRRTAATKLLKRGANIVTIQEILGHVNIQTTMVYLSADAEDMKDAMELLNRTESTK